MLIRFFNAYHFMLYPQSLDMTTVETLLQDSKIIILVVLVVTIVIINQLFWHRRQMKIIETLDRVRPGVSLPSQIPQILGIGFVILSVGIGGLAEAYFFPQAGGSLILVSTGLGMILISYFLYSSGGEESNNNS